ncbi:MAG: UDP-glucuronic acid decarboxylase family protein [Candidatus Omnitrophota bacterium]
MKTVLITGGAGFIGSHLCDFFLTQGYKVVCVDNLLTGEEKNVQQIKKDTSFTFIKHDMAVPLEFADHLDIVLHFASCASPVDYAAYPIETLKAGSYGTMNSLELARASKARFLLASTSEVYGDPLVHPQTEDYWGHVNPVGPRSMYDEAKRFAEATTMVYRRLHKVNTGIVRIFNTYGPRMRQEDGRAIPNFITQALKNDPITVYGTGSQTRSFCYVSDLIEGIFKLVTSDLINPVNLGNPVEMTIKDLALNIIKLTGSRSLMKYESLPKDDPKQRKPDITQAREQLKWQPQVGLDEGLAATIDCFKQRMI